MFSPEGRKVNRWDAGGVNQVDGGNCFTKIYLYQVITLCT